MTTVGPLRDLEMDASHPDDQMEVGTSPYPHADDIEFELDPVRDPSIDRSMADEAEGLINSADLMQDESENLYNDDEMFDDETLQDIQDPDLVDLTMDPPDQHVSPTHDEEILEDYEGTGSVDMTATQEESLEQLSADPDTQPRADIDEAIQAPEKVEGQDENHDPNLTDTNPTFETTEPATDALQQHTADSRVEQPETDPIGHAAVETDIVDFAAQQGTLEPGPDKVNHDPATYTDPSYQDNTEETTQSSVEQLVSEKKTGSPQASGAPSVETEEDVEEQAHNEHADADEHAASESEEHLHPITIVYMDQEMSLFPPMADDSSVTFFLSDSSLAYESFEKLLASCREILGESLEHDDELVLDIPALGLHICEDSKYASQIALSQIIEVYLHLSQNESIENIEPLYCNLSSRVCLASQYAYLTASAQEGKTYSEITTECLDSSEPEAASHSIPDASELEQPDDEAAVAEANVQSKVDSGAVGADPKGGQDEVVHQQPSQIPEQTEDVVHEQTLASDSSDATENPDAGDNSGGATAAVQSDALERNSDPHTKPDDSLSATAEPTAEDLDDNNDLAAPEHETGSDSSHTVQNESPDQPDTQVYDDADDAQVGQGDGVGDINQPDDDETDAYNLEDGFFSNEINEYAVDQAPSEDFVEPDPTGNTAAAVEQDSGPPLSGGDEETVTIDDSAIDDIYDDNTAAEKSLMSIGDQALQLVEDAHTGTPVTPSKLNGHKRKAIEEEELDFLDISTPEPKRTRASS